MNKTEYTLLTIFIIGIFLTLFNIDSKLLVVSTAVINLYYLIFSFAIFNQIKIRDIFKKKSYSHVTTGKIIISIFTGFFITIIVTGVEYKLLSYQVGAMSGGLMINSGMRIALIILIISIIYYLKNKELFYKNLLTRILVFLFLGIIAIYGIK